MSSQIRFRICFRRPVVTLLAACFIALGVQSPVARAQDLGQEDLEAFDHFELGPWSEIDRTTLTVPQVANGSVTLDGSPSSAEYGSFEAVEVVPILTGWVLNFPPDREWDGPEDSSFRFWLAHDESFLYIAADVTDDVVNADDPNESNWKDDSIELLFDPLNDKYDVTPRDNSPYGGHDGISWNGAQRAWDPDLGEPSSFGVTDFATEVDWSYGEEGDVFAVGVETETGYAVEARYHKRLFENPDVGNKLVEGYVMGFNITVDDDDGRGVGPNGTGERDLDEEVSYYWAQRERLIGWDELAAEDYTAEQIAAGEHVDDFELSFDPGGRLTRGAMGEIIFGGLSGPLGDFDGSGELDVADINDLIARIEQGDGGALYDLDGDGSVGTGDMTVWVTELKNTWIGDANLDGEFNSGDLVAVFTAGKFELDEVGRLGRGRLGRQPSLHQRRFCRSVFRWRLRTWASPSGSGRTGARMRTMVVRLDDCPGRAGQALIGYVE